MSLQQTQRPAEASGIFGPGEPVIQTHPLLPRAQIPQFGETEGWNLNGVVRRPARLHAAAWTLVFSRELDAPSWNLLARELSMIMLKPPAPRRHRHGALTETRTGSPHLGDQRTEPPAATGA